MYATFISAFHFLFGFQNIYQQTTYQNRENHLNVVTFHNIIIVSF